MDPSRCEGAEYTTYAGVAHFRIQPRGELPIVYHLATIIEIRAFC
jgi:hypothetical protein